MILSIGISGPICKVAEFVRVSAKVKELGSLDYPFVQYILEW